jgi:hypothetical protein
LRIDVFKRHFDIQNGICFSNFGNHGGRKERPQARKTLETSRPEKKQVQAKKSKFEVSIGNKN